MKGAIIQENDRIQLLIFFVVFLLFHFLFGFEMFLSSLHFVRLFIRLFFLVVDVRQQVSWHRCQPEEDEEQFPARMMASQGGE